MQPIELKNPVNKIKAGRCHGLWASGGIPLWRSYRENAYKSFFKKESGEKRRGM